MDYDIFKKKTVEDDLKDKNLNQIIASGAKSPANKAVTKLINFRVDEDTANRLDSLAGEMNKNKTTLFKAALLALENLPPDERLRLIGEVAN
ncbi:ribbon-helix-helix protein, CopG family [Providencia rettgeri]